MRFQVVYRLSKSYLSESAALGPGGVSYTSGLKEWSKEDADLQPFASFLLGIQDMQPATAAQITAKFKPNDVLYDHGHPGRVASAIVACIDRGWLEVVP